MGPSPTYHPPKEECETSVEHGLPLWAEPAVGYCSRQPRPSPMWGSRFLGARAVGPWVGEQKPLGKTPQRGNTGPELSYLPTTLLLGWVVGSSPFLAEGWVLAYLGVGGGLPVLCVFVVRAAVCGAHAFVCFVFLWRLCWCGVGVA